MSGITTEMWRMAGRSGRPVPRIDLSEEFRRERLLVFGAVRGTFSRLLGAVALVPMALTALLLSLTVIEGAARGTRTANQRLSRQCQELEARQASQAALTATRQRTLAVRAGRARWVGVLDTVTAALPAEVMLTDVGVESAAGSLHLTVQGQAASGRAVQDFLKALSRAPEFGAPALRDVTADPTLGPQGVTFHLEADLKPGSED